MLYFINLNNIYGKYFMYCVESEIYAFWVTTLDPLGLWGKEKLYYVHGDIRHGETSHVY